MNPDEFAASAAESAGHGHGDGVGHPSMGLFDALFSTRGGAPLSQIETEYGVNRPVALILRGLMKMAEAEGFPAIADIAAGVALIALASNVGASTGSGDEGRDGRHTGDETAHERALFFPADDGDESMSPPPAGGPAS